MQLFRVLCLVFVLTVAGASAACADNGPVEPDRAAVTYLTSFGAAPHDAFAYLAKEQGRFAEANLDVTIELGQGPQNYASVLSGSAEFAKVDITALITNIGRGNINPNDFVVLAMFEQQNLAAIVAPQSANINTPADLSGKTIAGLPGAPTSTLWPAYAALAGVDVDSVTLEDGDQNSLFGMLASGQVDALTTFGIQQGVIANVIGEPVTVHPYSQYLPDLLGTGLIASRAYVEENPDVAVRFRDALIEGLVASLAGPRVAIDALIEANPEQDFAAEAAIAQIDLSRPYITAAGHPNIGTVSESQVMRCIGVLQSAGVIQSGVTPDMLIDPAVTLLQ